MIYIINRKPEEMSDYEKQRERRIAQNKAKMEALGLQFLGNSLMAVAGKRKSKRNIKADEDVDYEPNSDEDLSDDDDSSDDNSDDRSNEILNQKKQQSNTKNNASYGREKVVFILCKGCILCVFACLFNKFFTY